MNIPENLKYSKSHEWVLADGDVVKIGITDYAQNALGDLVFVNLPEKGDGVECETAFADVESVKAVSDVISPVTGTVTDVNDALLDTPEAINEAPYDSWFIEVSDISETEELMTAAEYADFIEQQ